MSRRALKAQASAGGAQERAGVVPRAVAEAALRMDWGHLPFFLELVRTGSLARAAKTLSVDRNTVARRVAALEAELGLALFERAPQGWLRTPAGDELASLATRVEEDVLALARHADARDREVAGAVRLTSATHVAVHLLAPAVPALRARHPALVLEVVADARAYDLTRREADVALRMGRPRAAGLVTRKLSEIAYRIYGSRELLARRGDGLVDFERDVFVAVEERFVAAPQERWLERVAPRRPVAFRSNSTQALASAALAGAGLAVLPCFLAEREPELVALETAEPVPPHELWLLVHGDLRRTPRVRAVIAWVDETVAAARAGLCGAGPPRPAR